MKVYVERVNGQIVGKYALRQPGYAEEEVDDTHPDVVKFINTYTPGTSESNLANREVAKLSFDSVHGGGKEVRAIFDVLLGEFNILRNWLMSFKSVVAAANSLAELKTAVANLPNLPDRTLGQARNAYRNSIDSGNVDSPP